MIRGSCLCGGIRFEVDEVPILGHCHCSVCRKATGAAFGTWANVPVEKFRFLEGAELVQRGPEWAPGHARSFCRRCGSPAPRVVPEASIVPIAAGLLDDDPVVRPFGHVFVASKAPYWEIRDSLPQFETWVPGFAPKDLG
jgi:hypothetical protein